MAVIENEYLAAINGEQKGPLNGEELTALAEQGDLLGDTLVWCEGMAEWAEAATVAELAAVINPIAKKRKSEADAKEAAWKKEEAEEEAERKKAEAEAGIESTAPAPGVTIPTSLKDVKDLYKQQLGNAAQQIKSGFSFNASAGKNPNGPSKPKPKIHRLLIVGVILSISTVFIDFEDLPGLDLLGIENSQVSMFASALILLGGIGTLIRWLKRRK